MSTFTPHQQYTNHWNLVAQLYTWTDFIMFSSCFDHLGFCVILLLFVIYYYNFNHFKFIFYFVSCFYFNNVLVCIIMKTINSFQFNFSSNITNIILDLNPSKLPFDWCKQSLKQLLPPSTISTHPLVFHKIWLQMFNFSHHF